MVELRLPLSSNTLYPNAPFVPDSEQKNLIPPDVAAAIASALVELLPAGDLEAEHGVLRPVIRDDSPSLWKMAGRIESISRRS